MWQQLIDSHCKTLLLCNRHVVCVFLFLKYNMVGVSSLSASGILCLLAHWEWGHVLGIFFAWVAPSGIGTTVLCPCPGVLHPNYVLAISKDVGTASGHCVTFSPCLLMGCAVRAYVCVRDRTCMCRHVSLHVCTCSHVFSLACHNFGLPLFFHPLSLLFCTIMFTLQCWENYSITLSLKSCTVE